MLSYLWQVVTTWLKNSAKFQKKIHWCVRCRNFHHVFGRCSHMLQRCPTKFEHKVALTSGYHLIQFQPKRSTGGWDRSRGMSLTEHVFSGFLAHFWPLLPHASTQSNKIWPQGSPTLELLSPKVSAKMVHGGMRYRPRREGGKNTF